MSRQQSLTTIRKADNHLIDGPLSASLHSPRHVLTVAEIAHELRCSKAHVHNVIRGKVPGLPPLPVLRIGRRVLIRYEGLRAWMLQVEARAPEFKPEGAA